ncbi:peptidase C39 [Rhodococcus hoagii]|nr:peptidase C39 [Prescottella equi]NKS06749.1 peptidase C39 [Prescottella equi]NKT07363.1 peptidase C39 [Prescottella equi]NKT31664.1 peptidase C39 [Prescottella equi]NKT39413.1 peptidase C39 [Prescottella equi]
MTTKQLPYDRSIVRQETGYWCGPASAQVVLNSRGVHVDESTLAQEIGTTWNGTDFIGQIERVLDARAPDARYTSVQMPNDPPTADQCARLWRDIVRSIDAGWGVIVNIVAPPSNYPRAVAPSTISPAYSGGTVYHYMSVMGYDDERRSVWIADSGFNPFGYWLGFDQLATLIPPKGYCYADVEPAAAPAPPPAPSGMDVDALSQAMGGTVSRERYAALLPAFTEAMREAGCTTVERAAMWCAQLAHESVGLKYMSELWGPTSDQRTYDGRMGNGPDEGFKYRGRGPIQVTGRDNYTALSRWAHERGMVPSPTYFVDNPDELASDRYGFVGAVWYWTAARPQLNALADARNLQDATLAINGGLNGIADRSTRYQRCLDMGAALLPTGGTMTNVVEEGALQLRPHPGLLRKINRPQNVNESTRDPENAWPYAMWADVWNETVWDGYDIRPEYADVPDDVGRSLVALVQTIAARQVRIEKKLDQLLEGK